MGVTVTETRAVHRWTAEQMRTAGYELVTMKSDDGKAGLVWWKWGAQCPGLADMQCGDPGAWMPEAPPGPELSDEEVRRYVDALRKQARACRLPPNLQPYTYAADVIDWALQWDIGQRDRVGHDLLEEREALSRALRRRPL